LRLGADEHSSQTDVSCVALSSLWDAPCFQPHKFSYRSHTVSCLSSPFQSEDLV
jgi:hypothetical protein